jgi:bifunctional non-homologous end joining protein LigD
VATKKLEAYRAKRDFSQTREPSGEAAVAASNRLRFVIQKHAATRLHYDLRLELDGVFKSWAVTKGPSLDPHDRRLAVEVEDHPLDYGDFEGTIPKGQYGGGTVLLWDRGYWEPEAMSAHAGLAKGDLKFRLDGDRLHGSWVLVRIKNDRTGGKRTNWLLIKHRDEWAGDVDVAEAAPDSVKSFGDLADILAADTPAVWESHRPAEGGKAGAMLQEIIEEAARRKVGKQGAAKGKKAAGKVGAKKKASGRVLNKKRA